jgi:cyclophilin family peptidyl-prolyl cis-trans isomerase
MGSEKRERQKAGRQIRLEQARAAQARRARNRRFVYAGILVAVVIGLLFVLAPDDDDDVSTSDTTTGETIQSGVTGPTQQSGPATTEGEPEAFAYGTGVCPAADGSSPRTIDFDDAPQQCIDPARTYTAVFETSHGTIRVELDDETTPGAVNNFVTLARYHYYDDTKVFRTDRSIGIVQGGSPHTQTNGDPGPGYTIPDEGFADDVVLAGSGGPFTYEAGDLVYARPGGQPDSSSAQYFFCVNDDCANLDSQGIYVEFGRVTEGLDVLEAMLALDAGGAPSDDITVTSVTIEEA